MSATLCPGDAGIHRLAYHIVLGARDGSLALGATGRRSLFGQVEQVIGEHQGSVLRAGGGDDRVHVLCLLPALEPLGRLVDTLRRRTRDWMRASVGRRSFEWRDGCEAFRVSHGELNRLDRRIARSLSEVKTGVRVSYF
jgi:hypothetical protein